MARPQEPAFAPEDEPMKLKCAGKHVYGFAYKDGTIEVRCREKLCSRPGYETRHLFNPVSGVCVDLHVLLNDVDKPKSG